LGRCKQKQRGLRGLLCRWPSITEWEMYITAQGYRLRNDLCVEWDVKLYYTIPYPNSSVFTAESENKLCDLYDRSLLWLPVEDPYSNQGPILYLFRGKWHFGFKNRKFPPTPCVFNSPVEGLPLEFCNVGGA